MSDDRELSEDERRREAEAHWLKAEHDKDLEWESRMDYESESTEEHGNT